MADSTKIANLLKDCRVDLSWQREFYEDLHAHPELSHEEERTAGRILERLRTFDCEIVQPIGGFGTVAIFRNGPGPTALFRADFDGLPVQEETAVAYASRNGNMHACGHDMHTTVLLGACALLDAHRDAWSGTFLALFQPAEESSMGAKYMLADSLTTRVPKPDICLGQHVMPGKAGDVLSRPGAIMAGCDSLRITIHGRSAHASMPHAAVDPTYIAAMVITRLQAIVGREVAPHDFFVISVGELHSGDKNNIIPETAELVLNTRYYKPDVAKRVYASLERMVRAECVASDAPSRRNSSTLPTAKSPTTILPPTKPCAQSLTPSSARPRVLPKLRRPPRTFATSPKLGACRIISGSLARHPRNWQITHPSTTKRHSCPIMNPPWHRVPKPPQQRCCPTSQIKQALALKAG
ncbi:amidohydrolase family protein [Corynebacterium simulans]|nr:amidohydrolase family protein [Corynebacterium simulans]